MPNVDKLNSRSVTSMNFKYIAMVAVIAATLVGATAIATDSAFADGKKHYDKNQAISQANACGNGNYQRMSSVKTLAHKFRAMKTQYHWTASKTN